MDSFKDQIERDAAARRKRRLVSEKKADEMKVLGNAEYKDEQYEKALEFYSEVGR